MEVAMTTALGIILIWLVASFAVALIVAPIIEGDDL